METTPNQHEQTRLIKEIYAPVIRWLYKARDNPDDFDLDSLRARVVSYQPLVELVSQWEGPNRPEPDDSINDLCFGRLYAPVPRLLRTQVGTWEENSEYNPENDVCGRLCPYGLWKTTLEEDEVQGNSGCLMLMLFTQVFRIPLPPKEIADSLLGARLALMNLIPQVFREVVAEEPQQTTPDEREEPMSRQHVLGPKQQVWEGKVFDHNTQQYLTWPDGTYITEAELAPANAPAAPSAPAAPAIPTAPAPPTPAAAPVAPSAPTPAVPTAPVAPSAPTPAVPTAPAAPSAPTPAAPVAAATPPTAPVQAEVAQAGATAQDHIDAINRHLDALKAFVGVPVSSGKGGSKPAPAPEVAQTAPVPTINEGDFAGIVSAFQNAIPGGDYSNISKTWNKTTFMDTFMPKWLSGKTQEGMNAMAAMAHHLGLNYSEWKPDSFERSCKGAVSRRIFGRHSSKK